LKKNIILVVNPISGDLDKTDLLIDVQEFSDLNNFNLVIYETKGLNDVTQIQSLYEKYMPKRILVAGGDGTIKMVAEAMENRDVIIGILPAGSANGLSVDLNLPITLEENLIVAFLSDYIEMDMICINGKKSIHLSDIGLNADLVKNYEKSNLRGIWGYALQAYTTLKDSEEPFIDGKFELIILKNLDLLLLGEIIIGNMPIDSDDIVIISTKKAIIKTDRPVNFQIDGEYCGTENELEIHILHKQIKIAVP
jgi:diacylglycerol kinase (ATP)